MYSPPLTKHETPINVGCDNVTNGPPLSPLHTDWKSCVVLVAQITDLRPTNGGNTFSHSFGEIVVRNA